MTWHLRTPQENDWPAIQAAADASLPWQAAGNQLWVRNRKAFDDRKYTRRHYVVSGDDQAVIGYGSIEGGEAAGRFRVFVVMDPVLLSTAGEMLYRKLMIDLIELKASSAWAREEARDVALLEFFRRQGFKDWSHYKTPEGLELVLLGRAL